MNTNTNSPTGHTRDIAPEHIAQLLTRAAQQMDGDTVAALRRARNTALERQSQSKRVFALSTGRGVYWPMPHSAYQWVAIAILLMAALVGGINYWHHIHEREMSHLDIAILTDDLPMEIFIDR